MRIAKTLKTIDIASQMNALLHYLDANELIMAGYLFGSYGTNYQTPLSDVDIALLTYAKTSLQEELELMSDITGLLHEDDVNLVFLNKANLAIQYNVLDTGRLLYCRDSDFLADFREYVGKRYCDFRIVLATFNADYDDGLKEEFLHGRSG